VARKRSRSNKARYEERESRSTKKKPWKLDTRSNKDWYAAYGSKAEYNRRGFGSLPDGGTPRWFAAAASVGVGLAVFMLVRTADPAAS
jgi:hypothetical protein